MEVDEVYSQLNDKISGLTDKLSEFQGTIDSLKADLEQLKSALNDLKSATGSAKQDNSQQNQGLFDLQKKIEEANATAEKRYADQQGVIYKLAAQAEDAAKTLVNFPDTLKAMTSKAWEDGKKEILGTWEDSKKDLLNSLSNVTTGLIKDAKQGIKDEIKDELKSLILDDVKDVQAEAKTSQPPPLTDEELEAKVKAIVSKLAAEK